MDALTPRKVTRLESFYQKLRKNTHHFVSSTVHDHMKEGIHQGFLPFPTNFSEYARVYVNTEILYPFTLLHQLPRSRPPDIDGVVYAKLATSSVSFNPAKVAPIPLLPFFYQKRQLIPVIQNNKQLFYHHLTLQAMRTGETLSAAELKKTFHNGFLLSLEGYKSAIPQ